MKICPICEELIADEVNICKNCGFSFNGIKKVVETPIHKPKEKVRSRNNNRNNRNYKILQLSNVSLDEVNRWIDEHNGKIKIIGFYGSLPQINYLGIFYLFLLIHLLNLNIIL